MNPISSIGPQFPGISTEPAIGTFGKRPATAGSVSFQDVLFQSLQQVNNLDQQSQLAMAGALTDGDLTQAEVLTSVRKADLALRTMLQIRNKMLEAYNELMQMRM